MNSKLSSQQPQQPYIPNNDQQQNILPLQSQQQQPTTTPNGETPQENPIPFGQFNQSNPYLIHLQAPNIIQQQPKPDQSLLPANIQTQQIVIPMNNPANSIQNNNIQTMPTQQQWIQNIVSPNQRQQIEEESDDDDDDDQNSDDETRIEDEESIADQNSQAVNLLSQLAINGNNNNNNNGVINVFKEIVEQQPFFACNPVSHTVCFGTAHSNQSQGDRVIFKAMQTEQIIGLPALNNRQHYLGSNIQQNAQNAAGNAPNAMGFFKQQEQIQNLFGINSVQQTHLGSNQQTYGFQSQQQQNGNAPIQAQNLFVEQTLNNNDLFGINNNNNNNNALPGVGGAAAAVRRGQNTIEFKSFEFYQNNQQQIFIPLSQKENLSSDQKQSILMKSATDSTMPQFYVHSQQQETKYLGVNPEQISRQQGGSFMPGQQQYGQFQNNYNQQGGFNQNVQQQQQQQQQKEQQLFVQVADRSVKEQKMINLDYFSEPIATASQFGSFQFVI